VIKKATVLCDTTNRFGFNDGFGKHFDNLDLQPGGTAPLKGRMGRLYDKPTAVICRFERAEVL
jgi:hypothetical protein